QSRLSLLFNAFLKVPMQFLILLTGVLVFVFYHFHPAPLLWNPVEMRKLEARAPAAELLTVKEHYARAEASRQMTARAWVESRSPEARAAYQVAVSELGAARRDAVK